VQDISNNFITREGVIKVVTCYPASNQKGLHSISIYGLTSSLCFGDFEPPTCNQTYLKFYFRKRVGVNVKESNETDLSGLGHAISVFGNFKFSPSLCGF